MAAPTAEPLVSPEFSEEAWVEVLKSIDRTYQELLDHQVELEQRNRELEGMRAFLNSVLGAMSDVLIACGPEGQVLEVNRAFEVLAGRTRGDVLGTQMIDLFAEDDRASIRRELSRLRSGSAAPTAEMGLLTDEGGSTPLELSASPRIDQRRRFVGAVFIGRPLGELRRAYRELEDSHIALKATQSQLVHSEKLASLGRLVAGVAHELNNPISFVYGNAHALDRYAGKFETYFERVEAGASREELVALRAELKLDRVVQNMRNALSGALEGAERVRDIVGSLRRLSAEGTGAPEAFDLAEAAATAAKWVLKGRSSEVRPATSLSGPVVAVARPGHIQQVVMNLVQNALDAMEGVADPELALSVRHEGRRAVLEVADNGGGIDPAAAARVFDPFFTTKPVGQGTGLGLSISYKIAEENGGRLSFRQREGGGTVFRLDLPAEARDE